MKRRKEDDDGREGMKLVNKRRREERKGKTEE